MLTCMHNNYLYMGGISHACKCADLMCCIIQLLAEKFGEFGKTPMIRQTKTIESSSYNLLADILIRQLSFAKCPKKSQFAKLYHHTVAVKGKPPM